ncbi:MAG: type I-U CRISPR-associated protein Csx17 [Bryobacterales bacterium]|nr:type I-U CRISPR-associated protein Csx17 [Bryobacterales bacterium]
MSNTVHVHEMTGIKPDALATYLAGLGIFRLFAEQKDRSARGFWRNEHFVLVTELDWESVERFFLQEYKPTPILAPWSGGGGFLDIPDDDPGQAPGTNSRIDRLMSFTSPRFHALQAAIERARANIPPELPQARRERDRLTEELRAQRTLVRTLERGGEEHRQATKGLQQLEELRAAARERVEEVKSKLKAGLLRKIAGSWDGAAHDWFDASVILDPLGEPAYPPHLGTGGNEGNLDYTAAFQDNLCLLFEPDGMPTATAQQRLASTLLGSTAPVLECQSVGQFAPGRAGGVNMASGFEGNPVINPWEFVLMLEGAVVLVAGITRRGDVGRARISSPFWVEATAAGLASASELEATPRGEQWLPLWSHPLRYGELVELIREGRVQLSRGGATRAGDLVRAAARLGLARGIESLQRFAYLERNGQSNLAVSAGRFRVASRPSQALLDEIAPWIDRLNEHARDKNVPLRLRVIAKRAEEALFAVCRHDATPAEWRELLIALGNAELALLRCGKSPTRRPLPRLSAGWISAVDDGSERGTTTLRLALSLASQHRPPDKDGLALKGSVRCHFLPLDDPDREWPRFRLDERSGRAELDPECVCVGRNLVTDAIALVRRRSTWARTSDARRERAPQLPLWAVNSCEATLDEIGWWLRDDQFDDDVLRLVRPLLALDWKDVSKRGAAPRPICKEARDPLQMLFRLAHLPFDVPLLETNGKRETAVSVRLDPDPLRRLAAGDLDGALRVAVRRLNASGLRPVFRRGLAPAKLARRLAASLAFPISQRDAARAAGMVCKPYEAKEDERQSLLLST